MSDTVISALLDTLDGAELSLITRTLRGRERELEQRREDSLHWANEVVADDPQRRAFYQEWADNDEHEIKCLKALIEKLT